MDARWDVSDGVHGTPCQHLRPIVSVPILDRPEKRQRDVRVEPSGPEPESSHSRAVTKPSALVGLSDSARTALFVVAAYCAGQRVAGVLLVALFGFGTQAIPQTNLTRPRAPGGDRRQLDDRGMQFE